MAKASIPNVLGNYLELPNGDVVETDSVQWFDALANSEFRSFRFEDGTSPYTCRKEKVKGTDGYWYGYQRVNGKVTKRYIGKTSDVTQAQLLEVSQRFQLPNKSSQKLPNRLGNNSTVITPLPSELPSELLVEVAQLKAEVAQLKAEKEQLQQQLADCHQALDSGQRFRTETLTAVDPGKLLNQLRQQNKRTRATLKDIEDILSLITGD